MNEDLVTARWPFSDATNAPDTPGLYAWYAHLPIFPADLRHCIGDDGSDLGRERVRRTLASHSKRFDPQRRRLSSRGAFGARWRGDLIDVGRERIRKVLLDDCTPPSKSSMERHIENATSTEASRKLLAKVLDNAHPLLAAPIYIGVTNSLARRLREHTEAFRDLRESVRLEPAILGRIKNSVDERRTDFAHRAIAAEFEPEHLFVVTQQLSASAGAASADSVLRSAEWLLNRWYTPILGRD